MTTPEDQRDEDTERARERMQERYVEPGFTAAMLRETDQADEEF